MIWFNPEKLEQFTTTGPGLWFLLLLASGAELGWLLIGRALPKL